MSISVHHHLEDNEWINFVNNHSMGNVFHTREMYTIFDNTKGYKPEIWVVKDKGKVLSFMMPTLITLYDGIFKKVTSRYVVHGGVLCANNERKEEVLSLMLSKYIKKVKGSALFTEVRNLSDSEPLQNNLIQHHFEYENYLNYLIDINKEPENIFRSIGKRTRKHIRRELRKGNIFIDDVKDRDGIMKCYEMLKKSYKNAKVPLTDFSLIESAFNNLFSKGMIKFTLASVNGQAAATSIDLMFKKVLYGWYGGMDRRFAKYMPNEALTWSILKWGAENGFEIYDFGGAGRPDEEYGVRNFKAKFGGKLVCYGRNTYVHSPLKLKFSKIAYKFLKPYI